MRLLKHYEWKKLQSDFQEWHAEAESRKRIGEGAKRVDTKIQQIAGMAGSLGKATMSAPKGDYPLGAKGLGRDVFPFGLPRQEVRKAYEAVKRGGNYIIEGKDFASNIETKDTF